MAVNIDLKFPNNLYKYSFKKCIINNDKFLLQMLKYTNNIFIDDMIKVKKNIYYTYKNINNILLDYLPSDICGLLFKNNFLSYTCPICYNINNTKITLQQSSIYIPDRCEICDCKFMHKIKMMCINNEFNQYYNKKKDSVDTDIILFNIK